MKIFVISDTHLNHTNIIKYCNRPFSSVEEMNKAIIDNWNNTVGPDDYVYMLGDFCLGGVETVKELCSQLNGHKILIKGNHDHCSNKVYREAGFETVVNIPEISKEISPVLSIIPLQILAYYISKEKGLDVDKPRNLAKSVTVE